MASFTFRKSRNLLAILLLTLFFNTACSSLFPTEAGEELSHFSQQAPQVGARAPDFTLSTIDGSEVSLESLLGEKPIVIQLGSYTCPVFRYRRFYMRPLREKFKDQVHFLVLYTQEAHPEGSKSPYADREWVPWINKLAGVKNSQASSLDARVKAASHAKQKMESNALFVVDSLHNETWEDYGAAPSAAFVLDLKGTVVTRQVWVDPEEIERVLHDLLNDF